MTCATWLAKAGIQDSKRVALDPLRDASVAGRPSQGGADRGHMERLAMPRPFMHLQCSGGPWDRRKRFRRSVAQWLEHRSPKPGVGGSSPSTPAMPELHSLNF